MARGDAWPWVRPRSVCSLLLERARAAGVLDKPFRLEIVAGRLRFPKRTITTNTLPGGVVRTIVITFSEIVVNPDLPDALFVIPAQLP